MKPVLNLLVTVSAAWSALTFALIVKPIPLGSSIFGGSSSCLWICPNSLDVQSLDSNEDSSTTGSLGSKTISVLWYFFKYANI